MLRCFRQMQAAACSAYFLDLSLCVCVGGVCVYGGIVCGGSDVRAGSVWVWRV